jgi:hypothetical protein
MVKPAAGAGPIVVYPAGDRGFESPSSSEESGEPRSTLVRQPCLPCAPSPTACCRCLHPARTADPVRPNLQIAAAVRASEQMVLTAERDRSDDALDRVVIELDAAVVEEAGERRPSGECAADRLGGQSARLFCPVLVASQPGEAGGGSQFLAAGSGSKTISDVRCVTHPERA